jgi:hypothetical protein
VVVPPSRRRKPRPKVGRAVVLTLLAVLGVAVLWWAYGWMKYFLTLGDGDPEAYAKQGNFQFRMPAAPWKRDKGIELALGVNLGLRRSNPANATGLFYKDYQTRLPSDAELVDTALAKLRRYFQPLFWELKPESRETHLGGQPAIRIEFEGDDREQVTMNGECVMMAHRGYTYWFFTWGPLAEKEQASAEWDGLRERFGLLGGREGWREKPRETLPLAATDQSPIPYRLDYVKGLWEPEANPRAYDPRADRVLLGHDPTQAKHAGKSATLRVLILPEESDLKQAAAAAQTYLLKRQQAEDGENYPMTAIAPVKDKSGAEQGGDADVGAVQGHLSKLRVTNDETRERYVLLAVVHQPKGVLVLMGDCDWGRRDFWEQEFLPLIQTLRIKDRKDP